MPSIKVERRDRSDEDPPPAHLCLLTTCHAPSADLGAAAPADNRSTQSPAICRPRGPGRETDDEQRQMALSGDSKAGNQTYCTATMNSNDNDNTKLAQELESEERQSYQK